MENMNLQLFAVQTSLLNGTGNDLSPEVRTFYDLTLIDEAEPNLVHDQFGQKRPIPHNGGKTIQFRRFAAIPAKTAPITEGVTPANNASLNVTEIKADLEQYGDYVELSDVLELTAVDNMIVETTKILGAQAGRTLDIITRDVVIGGTNVIYTGGKTSRAALEANLSLAEIFKAAALLKANNAPKIDGSYIAIVHPHVAHDLMTAAAENASWIDINKYASPENIFNGEIGKVGGVRFIESTEAKIWTGEDCPSGKAVYATLVFGANAYGVTELNGGMELIVKQAGYGNDPLNQRSSVGWKCLKAASVLVEDYLYRIESLSSFSTTAEAN